LVKSGLAERRASSEDGRVVLVSATEVGRSRHGAIAITRRAFMQAMLAPFDADERRQLADLLERLVRALDDFAAGLT
jgi:DNA-binding MarR family transcriptional regulator